MENKSVGFLYNTPIFMSMNTSEKPPTTFNQNSNRRLNTHNLYKRTGGFFIFREKKTCKMS